jgi:hypothetical protein
MKREPKAQSSLPRVCGGLDQVLGVVGGVGHDDRHGVALEDVEAGPDRHPESLFIVGGMAPHPWVGGRDRLDGGGRAVLAAVVDDDDLVIDLLALERGGDAYVNLRERRISR